MNEWWLLICFLVLGLLALLLMLYPLRKARVLSATLLPMLILVSFFAYWHWGAWVDWQKYLYRQAQQQKVQAVLKTIKDPRELIARMQARLQENPKSARGWYLLGRLYISQNEWLLARDAFYKAHQLSPEDENTTVNYAQTLWQLNKQQFDQQTRTLFKTLLQKNPQQPDALAMLAIDAFTNHNYQLAIDYWQELLSLAPKQSEEAQLIRKAIARAQQKNNGHIWLRGFGPTTLPA
jgi:cytochrome c-type biogenesis protein CcmH